MRLFVALEPPAGVRAALADWARAALADDPQWRPVAPAALHLTLAFLGERPDGEAALLAPELARALGRTPPPRDARVSAPLWLAPRRPHVLTAAVEDPSGRLDVLREAVVDACRRAVGWEPEGRAFRPHVTVARLRRNTHASPFALPELPPAALTPWRTGAGVTLLRSTPGGQYEALWGREG